MLIKINNEVKDLLTIKLPKFIVEKINSAIDTEISNASDIYDPFGFYSLNRTFKSNINSFRDKVFYLVYKIYNHLTYRTRYNGKVLCTDFSEKQLTELLGDCTRNRTKIGWQSIKDFLISNDIIFVADKLYIHDSYLNKPQNIGYSINEFKGLTSKPVIKVSITGHVYSSSHQFKTSQLELVEYIITNKNLLKSIAKTEVITIDTDTIVGHQWELLMRYSANKSDYEFVKNCVTGKPGIKYLFHPERNMDSKPSECTLLKVLSNPDKKMSDFRVRQSIYSSRIFSPITSAKKYARSFINFNDKDNIFAEFDMKSSQLTLAALLYHKYKHNLDSEKVLNTIVRCDIYQMISDAIPKIDRKSNIAIGRYSREEMKKLAFKSIFSKREYSENAFTEGLKLLFPQFYRFLNSQKTKSNHSKLAIKLQRLESAIFVGNYGFNYVNGTSDCRYSMPFVNKTDKCVLGELYKLGIDAFSIHDAILVNVSQASKVTGVSIDNIYEEVIAPIIFKIFRRIFGDDMFGVQQMNWIFGVPDEMDEFFINHNRSHNEMKLITRCDNFNQFSSELFNKINKKYNTKLEFYNISKYKEFSESGDFRIDKYDEPDSDSYWDTHDRNAPEYKEYWEFRNSCPF